MIDPGYTALFIVVSIPTTIPAPWVRNLKPWHLLTFLPVLFLFEQLILLFIPNLSLPSSAIQPIEFVQNIAQDGIKSSIGVYFFSSLVVMVALILKANRKKLFLHRLVDTEDEWNRLFEWYQSNQSEGELNEFRFRLLSKRCFAFVAERFDTILASAILIPSLQSKYRFYISDFIFKDENVGIEFLSFLLNRPELKIANQIHFVHRKPNDLETQSLIRSWFDQAFNKNQITETDLLNFQEIVNFSPDGSSLRPFRLVQPNFTFIPEQKSYNKSNDLNNKPKNS